MTIMDLSQYKSSNMQLAVPEDPANDCRETVFYSPEKDKPVRRERCPADPSNLGSRMVRLHFHAYRAACNAINNTVSKTGLYVINTVSIKREKNFENYSEVGTSLRQYAPIDYTYVTFKRVVNKVCKVVGDIDYYDPEDFKTNNQRLKEREIKEMNLLLGEESAYSKFCFDTAKLVDDLFPKLVIAQMITMPSLVEQTLMYSLWLPYRYVNYQVNRRTGYRQIVLDSDFFKTMTRIYWCVITNFGHNLLCHDNVSSILNFEHVLLQICMKLKPKIEVKNKGTTLTDVIIGSVAKSIDRLQQCNAYMNQLSFDSIREAFIERLEWYRQNDCLPPGMPNPGNRKLNISNLEEELDRAMYQYLDQISTLILDELAPKKFKNKFVQFVYWLEGKNGLVKLLSFLIGELGVKQVSDPHLFALAILSALGKEVADYELDGFGRNKMETILKVGEKMIRHSLEEGIPSSVVVEDFLNTGLVHNPQSLEGIKQKKEAREALEKLICKLAHDGIKPESYRYDRVSKHVRKFMQGIPVLGMATVIMNTVYSTLHLSISYYFRSKDQAGDSLPVYIFKSMWGEDYTKILTKKTMDLIYHPGWRFIALQLIQDVTNHIFNKGQQVHQLENGPTTNENIRTIASFLINHYVKGSTYIHPIIKFMLSDETIDSTKKLFDSPGQSFLETAMESILPTIRELTLYIRVGEGFRMDNIHFVGDAKFWELYIREYLNRSVKLLLERCYLPHERSSQVLISKIRDELVKEMLEMDRISLRRKLISPRTEIDTQPSIKMDQELQDGILIWDYPDKDEILPLNGRCKEKPKTSLKDDFIPLSDEDEKPFTFSIADPVSDDDNSI